MVHGPCGKLLRSAPCLKDGRCSKYFSKRYTERTVVDENSYPTYRRRNNGRMVTRNGVELDNRYVVPYNARLLKLFAGHLNVEKTNQSRAIKYLFKYISKGHDRVIAGIYNANDNQSTQQTVDEISHSLNCRDKRIWKLRERGFSVGRLGHCTPSQGELYYLRLLLTKVRGAKHYASIRTVNNVVYPTFREACYALGLLDDDKEYIDAIKEASVWATGNYLRQFFTSMLLSHSLFDPAIVWEQTKEVICEDLLHVNHRDERFQDLQITNANKEAAGLANIQQLLLRNGRSLNDYPSMPKPDNDLIIDTSDQLILQELNYNKEKEMETSSSFERLMTEEQKKVYEQIINAISSKKGGIPHHKLVLKVGVPVMLIRNIDQAARLCN
ncbi:hypothetical protein K1719_011937 [Acacia pycnantha]|nr:hypothetical protein K1719_011937 [Acacia pycnantha]